MVLAKNTRLIFTLVPALVSSVPLSTGCRGLPYGNFCTDTKSSPAAEQDESKPTLADVTRVIATNCLGCHETGGVGPQPLDTVEQLKSMKPAIAAAVESGSMPPWLPSSCCNSYLYNRGISDADKNVILRWASDKGTAGDASADEEKSAQSLLVASQTTLSRVDYVLRLPQPHLPRPTTAETDDHRCFLLDWPFQEARFVTGFNPRPDRRSIVHHLVLSAVEGDALKELQRRDDADSELGFSCAGGLGTIKTSAIGGGLIGSD